METDHLVKQQLPRLRLLVVASEQLVFNKSLLVYNCLVFPISFAGAITEISGIFCFLKIKHYLNCHTSALCQGSKMLKLKAILILSN